ncbi:alpha/beta hydrolase fold-domain-containing protein [Macrophomina phaseolina]|uniref:Alpha/beta hydrolase fold-domain-containing protein n=1 Tax=Macrophomina phaseolina TaxID=35725 RepID=A0ABQ8G278_9PEZI|nr:alpha/beta hydrolase fold-domain-containing protein [Macrophomina phaseolina]
MHRRNRTARTTLLHQFLRPFRSQLVKPSEPFPPGSPRLTPHPSCAKICGVHERQVAGIWLYDLEPKTSHKTTSKATTSAAASHLSTAGEIAHEAAEEDTLRKNRENAEGIVRRIYYIAGGSWREPPSHQHWKFMAKLAAATPGTAVSVVSVPLAPNETAQTVFPRLLTLYERVMEESTEKGERALWAGDSSGGNIVLGLVGEALRAREGVKPLPAPSALLIICPSVDARRENEKIEAIQDKDPILIATESKQQAADWAGDWSLDDERISPAVNYTGKDNLIELLSEKGVKVHGITAGYDILSPDAIILRERLEKGGVYGKWLHWDKQMHCFPLAWFYGLPESKEGLHWIIRVLQEE